MDIKISRMEKMEQDINKYFETAQRNNIKGGNLGAMFEDYE